jgi:hypothetical protein
MEILGDECDVEIIVDDGDYEVGTDAIAEDEMRQSQVAEEARVSDTANYEFIQRELARLVPDDKHESTLDAFSQLTSEHAWIPFRMPDSEVPATEVDTEEASYFNDHEASYSVATNRGPRSYKNFAIAWNLEVSRRFKLWTQGQTELVQMRLKSQLQLEEYYNKRKELQSLQRTAEDTEETDNDQALLDTQFRTTRSQLPPRQEPHVVAPTVYTVLGPNSITPFAHPTTLNASVAVGAVMGTFNHMFVNPRRSMNMPFQMQLPPLPKQPMPRPVRKVFRSKCYCITCGWRKKEHTASEGKGQKPEHCKREFCGNCFLLKAYHTEKGIAFGKDCPSLTNPSCFTNVNEWWTYTVSYT